MFTKNFSTALAACALFLSTQALAEKYPKLPQPYETQSVTRPAKILGWPEGITPIAPPGWKVSLFASLDFPRSIYVMPNGDVAVSQARKAPSDDGIASPNKITLFKMDRTSVRSVHTLKQGLDLPFGMAQWKNEFFIAEPTRILRYRIENGELMGDGEVIAELPFPTPQHHWTRHLLLDLNGHKLYVSVGSASNVGEDGDPLDPKTAAILQMNRDGSDLRIYAGGLRNPVSMAWYPTTGALWTTVNERDRLGDGLVPDYITEVKRGGFYGWPYAYWGNHEDPRRAGERPDLVAKTLVPNFSVGAHTGSLGITFTTGTQVPAPFHQGALIAQHGSWNSSVLVGYKVLYVPFENGDAVDPEADFLTGFIASEAEGTVYGRPVATAVLADGSVLVTDDGAGKIWKVEPIASFYRGISAL